MSMDVCNEHGSLGQFATNKGYMDLIDATEDDDTLSQFFEDGWTEDCTEISEALILFASKTKDEGVADTARTLGKLMRGQDIAIIHDGMVADDEEGEEGDESEEGEESEKVLGVDSVLAATELFAKYDKDQVRDKNGRWASEGGASAAEAFAKAKLEGSTKLAGEKVKQIAAAQKPLSAAQQKAVDGYCDFESEAINEGLRRGIRHPDLKEAVDRLDGAMQSVGEAVVFRGAEFDRMPKFKAGTVFSDKAYISTSTNLGTALSFSGSHYPKAWPKKDQADKVETSKGSVLFRLELSAKTKGHPRGGIEKELIVARGTKFKVSAVETVKSPRFLGTGLITVVYGKAI